MYSPAYNQVEDRAEVLAFMRANNFVLLVTGTDGELHASHLPVMVHERDGQVVIDMHMARANPQWLQFFDEEVMVVFWGPHAYVSPRWYAQKDRVPTWNYAAVHAYGKVRVLDERDAKLAAQLALVRNHDPAWEAGFAALTPKYLDDMLGAIVNFEITVTRLETRWKLSQNRGRREQERIITALENSDDPGERALAELTRKHLAPE
jgi:transcriptional regulator